MKPSITIIGAGAVGCLTALTFAKQDWKVTLVDQGVLGGEASWAGGGILFPLLPWHYKDEVNELAFAGAALYPDLCAELLDATGIDPEYSAGGMRLFPEFENDAQAWCEAHEVAAEAQGATLFLPNVAQVRNPRLLAALKARLLSLGVALHEGTELLPLKGDTGQIQEWQSRDGKHFVSDIYVVTAGAWSALLLDKYVTTIPVKPMRGQMLLYKVPSQLFSEILYHKDFYLVPRRDGHVLAGSTVEDVGFDKSTTAEVGKSLAQKATQLMPALKEASLVRHWSGLRPGSPENIPLIGLHPEFENLYLNTGHFRYGVTMAPMSATKLLQQVLASQ
jgi:glycine oxidase